MTEPLITVVVCTLASERRKMLLERALASILDGQDGLARPLVVVNGAGYDARLLADLARRSDIDLLQRDKPDLPAALRAGRSRISTPFFCTLDDDDELLAGGLRARLDALLAAQADLVVSNGFYDDGGTAPRLQYEHFDRFAGDPLRSVLRRPGCNRSMRCIAARR